MVSTKNAIARIIIWGLVAVILTSTLSGFLKANETGKFTFDDIISLFNIGTVVSYENEGNYSVGSASVSTDGIEDIEINWTSGSVLIKPTDDKSIIITDSYDGEDKDGMMRYSVSGGTLKIQFCKSRASMSSYRNKDLTLELPSELAKNLDELEISVTSAGLTVTDIYSKQIDIDTVSGDINMTGCSFKEADISGVSGDVSMSLTACPHEINCDTVSGSAELYIPDCDGFSASIDSVSGRIATDFACTQKGGDYVYGDGSAHFDFETVSGNASIFMAK